MFYLGLIIVIASSCMYLVSRINCSKYKGKKINAVGYYVYHLFEDKINLDSVKAKIHRKKVTSDKELNELAKQYIIVNISACFWIVFITGLGIMATDIGRFSNQKEESSVLFREDVNGYENNVDIVMKSNDETTEISFCLEPRVLSREEFEEYVEREIDKLYETKFGDENESVLVMNDLELPDRDQTGIIKIAWTNNYPEYITSIGRIDWDNISDDIEVILTAKFLYEDYSKEHDFYITLAKRQENAFELAENELVQLEESTRDKKDFVVPQNIGNIELYLDNEESGESPKILFLGIISCVIVILFRNRQLDIDGEKNRKELVQMYPIFVNRLWLYIGAGMTIKNSLILFQREEENSFLAKKIECIINKLKLGFDEASCYENLGTDIGLPEYNRLMSHISQNLVKGTKDIRQLMELEIIESMRIKRDIAKKKGEEASTKMLFPMIILLCSVLLIVMAPAIMTF